MELFKTKAQPMESFSRPNNRINTAAAYLRYHLLPNYPIKMQVISFLLFALGANALPTILNSTTTTDTTSPSASHLNHLEARWHYPWIGSSPSMCKTSELTGPRPGNKMECVPFHPITQGVSIFWGTGDYGAKKMWVYDHDDCSGEHWKFIQSGNGRYTCLSTTEEERRRWKAVAYF